MARYADRLRVTGVPSTNRVSDWLPHKLIRSVQYAQTASLSGATSATATITAVVTANCLLLNLGATANDTTGATDSEGTSNISNLRVELTNTTTVTAYRISNSATVIKARVCVIEFWPGVIKSNQVGNAAIGVGATATITLTSVDTTKTVLSLLGTTSTGGNFQAINLTDLVLTNATTATVTTITAAGNLVAYIQAVEFY